MWAGVVANADEVGGRYCEDCHVAALTDAEMMDLSAGVRPYALDAERAKALKVGDALNRDAAWFYPEPKPDAEAVAGRMAFWRGVEVRA